jgi:hypothetical protein
MLLARLAGEKLAGQFPPVTSARVTSGDLPDLQPVSRTVDLAATFLDASGAKVAALAAEIQRHRDDRKKTRWPYYHAALHDREGCWSRLVVIATTDEVARWAATPIETFFPGYAPIVLGPSDIPMVTSTEQARLEPELAVLSAAVHGNEPRGEHVVLAALAGAAGLEESRGRLYADVAMAGLTAVARVAVEALMESQGYEYQSEFARKYFADGKADGKAEGKAQAIVVVLRKRGVPLNTEAEARILACRDSATLDRWLGEALSVGSVGELIGD